MLSAGELSEAAGLTDAAGKPSVSGGASVCTWSGAGGKTAIVQVYPTVAGYENSRRAFEDLYETTATSVSNVGDDAFYMEGKTGPFQTGTLSAKRGSSAVSVQLMGGNTATLREQTLALANLLLAKL